jgi:hypothetical protein
MGDPIRALLHLVRSMAAIAFDTAGCDTESFVAAFAMLPQSATVTKVSRSRSFNLRRKRASDFTESSNNIIL